ncbi:MAG TPA: argininosuccinate synthase [Elusimicrobiota bacterium]|jgi:argininosuccinate synthase|nr:argininosuccinate synthase [Elusimicrobiota bacterium]
MANKYSSGTAVLAFSGGLDTCFCAAWLKEKGYGVAAVTVDTGGFVAGELEKIKERALAAGAAEHVTLDGRDKVFSRFVAYLIKGNVLRGRVYPLSVSAERVVQAELVAAFARKAGAQAVAHGSTAAGNDQFRFDGVFQALCPDLQVLAPIRELGWTRAQETAYLKERGLEIPAKTAAYSVNAGLWGVTVGGKETHDPWAEVPESAYPEPTEKAVDPVSIAIGFERGLPVSLNGEAMGGVRLVEKLNALGRSYGLGRGIHLGDTVLGIKGRIAFEAPAPVLLIAAHRELEKLTLTRWQQFWKDHMAEFYGQLLHEGLPFEPAMRDIEAMMDSSQEAVTGDARLKLSPGHFEVTGVRSPNGLMESRAAYGETTSLWSAQDAAGFARIHALPMVLANARRGEE